MSKAKPDCTGQRFGRLTVLEQGNVVKKNGRSRRLWILQCDCGKIIERQRGDFDRRKPHIVSCGCQKKNHPGRKPKDLTGQKFGQLTVTKAVLNKRISPGDNSRVWLCRCDCGNFVEKSTRRLHCSWGLHCGESNAYHLPYAKDYPPTPIPYPQDATEILKKWQYLVKKISKFEFIDFSIKRQDSYSGEVQDERWDRLIRACWIIAFRQRRGEELSDLYIKRLIIKHLKYSFVDVYRRKRAELDLLDINQINKYNETKDNKIGKVMTKESPNVRVNKALHDGSLLSKIQILAIHKSDRG